MNGETATVKLLRKLRRLFQRRKVDAEIADELQAHVEAQAAVNLRAGMPPEEALQAARRQFGHIDGVKEAIRDQRSWVWMEQILHDLRYAMRQFAKSPVFTIIVVLTLALGIGATTAIYSVVDAVILNPVPGPNAERVIQIGEYVKYSNRPEVSMAGASPPVVEALVAHGEYFADLAWFDSVQLERKTNDFPVFEAGAAVSPNFFSLLGVRVARGRTFAPDEGVVFERDMPAVDTVMIISHSWWKSHFGGDRDILGRTIRLGSREFTIIGVMPEYFRFGGNYWIPAKSMRLPGRSMSAANTYVFARLKPDRDSAQVQVMLDTITKRLLQDYPAGDRWYGDSFRRRSEGLRLWAQPLREALSGDLFHGRNEAARVRSTLFGLLGAIGFVLLIVCANVANLTMARTERRQQELAVRAALGAGRGRLIRQLLTENLLLAGLGGVAGLIVTWWGMQLLLAVSSMARLRPVEIDGRVLGTALLVSLFAGLAFGVAPALRAGRVRLKDSLAQGGMNATAGVRGARWRGVLVMAQVAFSVVLLAGAGLMLRSVVRLLSVDPGFDPENVLFVDFRPYGAKYNDRTEGRELRNALYARLHDQFTALPGVRQVGFVRRFNGQPFIIGDRNEPVEVRIAGCGVGSSDYFRAMRVPVLEGRLFRQDDVGANVSTAIVNEALARQYWPGESAIGKKLRPARGELLYDVVGVVGDARNYSFDEVVEPTFYRPYYDFGVGMTGHAPRFVLRADSNPGQLISAVRNELKAAEPDMQPPTIRIAQQVLYDSTLAHRTYRNYLVAFAGVGLVLSALGIYGMLAYSVARRTREIGIRMAIGAERRHVIAMIVTEGTSLIAMGAVAGLLASFWLTRYLRSQLFEISPNDPIVLLSAITVLFSIGILACFIPARRAANIDPVVALRTE